MSRALDQKPEMTNARADYYGRIGEHNMTPLWEVIHKLLAKEPVTEATPHIWKYGEIRDLLLESANVISAAEAERRATVDYAGRNCANPSSFTRRLTVHHRRQPRFYGD